MNNLGNVFLQSLNQTLQQSNYLNNIVLSQNTSLLMGNNPAFSINETKTYKKPIICGRSVCEGAELFDDNDKVET
jgi:hypothetical protein